MQALVTGASRGIGAALLTSLTAHGYHAHGTTRGTPNGPLRHADIASPASIHALAQSWGDAPLDLLVCNAGVLLDRNQSLDTGYDPQIWADSFAVNVTGVFLTAQAFLPALRLAAQGSGSAKIAIISSQLGSHSIASGGLYAYRASKAAALNIGRNLAADLAPDNISVGIYHPGWVRSDMGGSSADISVQDSANGLTQRFAALGAATTGCFETWDGKAHPM